MNIFSVISAILGSVVSLVICYEVLFKGLRQNIATFSLWTILDGIATVATILQGGNFLLPLVYTVGSVLIVFALLKSKNFEWTWVETMDTVLVAICVAAWSVSGPRIAIVLSTLSVAVAGMPLAWDSFKNPWNQPFVLYLGFLAANAICIPAGNAWTIEERFFPYSNTVLCVIIVLFMSRKFWSKREPVAENPLSYDQAMRIRWEEQMGLQ